MPSDSKIKISSNRNFGLVFFVIANSLLRKEKKHVIKNRLYAQVRI